MQLSSSRCRYGGELITSSRSDWRGSQDNSALLKQKASKPDFRGTITSDACLDRYLFGGQVGLAGCWRTMRPRHPDHPPTPFTLIPCCGQQVPILRHPYNVVVLSAELSQNRSRRFRDQVRVAIIIVPPTTTPLKNVVQQSDLTGPTINSCLSRFALSQHVLSFNRHFPQPCLFTKAQRQQELARMQVVRSSHASHGAARTIQSAVQGTW